jgi:hypothetical protein
VGKNSIRWEELEFRFCEVKKFHSLDSKARQELSFGCIQRVQNCMVLDSKTEKILLSIHKQSSEKNIPFDSKTVKSSFSSIVKRTYKI